MSTRSSRRRRGGHDGEHEENAERWLLTYADMITLLMVLFIVMFAISQVDKTKFAKLQDGLAREFGAPTAVIPGGTGALDGSKSPKSTDDQMFAPVPVLDQTKLSDQLAKDAAARAELAKLEEARERIKEALREKGLESSARLTISERGLVVTIVTDEVLFETGRAELRPLGAPVLDAIAPVLATLTNRISVEGHTDDVPIHGGRFASNWELSAERATTVVRYLIDAHQVAPARLSSTGYADQQPLASNATTEGRSKNRRVEIVVLASRSLDLSTSTLPAGQSTKSGN